MPKTKSKSIQVAAAALGLLVSADLALGCGRSPAAPPSRVPSAVPCACDLDDDDDDDDESALAARRASSVEYVRIEEWRPSESVQRLESQITARGDAQPSYIDFPKLTRHEPIPEPRIHGGFRIPRTESPRAEGARTESQR